MPGVSNEPVREVELVREFSSLERNVSSLEQSVEVLWKRLERYASASVPKESGSAGTTENSSPFGQQLNNVNSRLFALKEGLVELLQRLEI